MADVPIHTSRASEGSPGTIDYVPGDPGVVISRTWIDVPGELYQYWVRDQEHANQVWRDHFGSDYTEPA